MGRFSATSEGLAARKIERTLNSVRLLNFVLVVMHVHGNWINLRLSAQSAINIIKSGPRKRKQTLQKVILIIMKHSSCRGTHAVLRA